MTEIMPVPRNQNFTVLPAGSSVFLLAACRAVVYIMEYLTVWINLCGHEPGRESEAFSLIERRIRRLFAVCATETQR